MSNIVHLKDLQEWAEEHKNFFLYGDIVAVNGQMGFGKTTLIRHLISAYGSNLEATSPTFALMDVHAMNGEKTILHIDAYRLKDESEALGLGIDIYDPTTTLIFIEWSQNIPEYILRPNKVIEISLSNKDDVRKINYFSV
ncbi:MAG: tRNA (adenosine(37)-N6)-threonylcarbamoyltransferase complex ATPase subunit type 1 TsaE [Gammaproteobacteria bacterium]|nr:tRNA (adenosine(37)-N6)-threonylcarbamoyltransferase complex ATPase subunit type 1 TsaE [Gammaproteobacteria bacterium]